MRIYQKTRVVQSWLGPLGKDIETSHTIDRTPFGIGYRYTHAYAYNGKRNQAQSGERFEASLPNGWTVSVSNLASTWHDQWSLAVLDRDKEFVQLPQWLADALDGSTCLECVEFTRGEMSPDAFAEIYHAAAAAVKGSNQ